jgi:hypothetical protein
LSLTSSPTSGPTGHRQTLKRNYNRHSADLDLGTGRAGRAAFWSHVSGRRLPTFHDALCPMCAPQTSKAATVVNRGQAC